VIPPEAWSVGNPQGLYGAALVEGAGVRTPLPQPEGSFICSGILPDQDASVGLFIFIRPI
jgi:hypothetical protein